MKIIIGVILMAIAANAAAGEKYWHKVKEDLRQGQLLRHGKTCFASFAPYGNSSVEIVTANGDAIYMALEDINALLTTTRLVAGYTNNSEDAHNTWVLSEKEQPFFNRNYYCIEWMPEYIGFRINGMQMFSFATPDYLKYKLGYLKINGMFIGKSKYSVLVEKH